MKLLNKAREKYTIVFSVFLALAFVLLNKMLGLISDNVVAFIPYYYQDAVDEFFTLLLALVFVFFCGVHKSAFQRKDTFLNSLKVGGFELAMIALSLISVVTQDYSFEIISFDRIVGSIIFVIFVGLAEELMFRGIIENILLDKYGTSYNGVLMSVFLTGAMFGLAHLSNLTMDVPTQSVIIQVLQNIVAGSYYAAIYARTKNIWAVAFLHSLSDFSAFVSSGYLWGVGNVESCISNLGVLNLITVIIYLIPTLYLLDKRHFNTKIQ